VQLCVLMTVAAMATVSFAQSLFSMLVDGWQHPSALDCPVGSLAPWQSRLKRLYSYTMCKPIKQSIARTVWCVDQAPCGHGPFQLAGVTTAPAGGLSGKLFDAPVQPPPIRWCVLEEILREDSRKECHCFSAVYDCWVRIGL
jgi:hypothetical protein